MSLKRKMEEDVEKAKDVVRTLAGVAAGFVGLLDRLDRGDDLMDAALQGVLQGRKKAKEMLRPKKTSKRLDPITHEERMASAACGCGSGLLFTRCHGVRGDRTAKPFELCPCESGLPRAQCHPVQASGVGRQGGKR